MIVENPVIDTIMNRKSIRSYSDEVPSPEVIETVVRAGQQAPFAYQLGSLVLSRDRSVNQFRAPLEFTICVDSHRFELIMQKRGWKIGTNDLSLMVLGIQDAALMAENMVIAAESLGLGSCFLGAWPYKAKELISRYQLPERVFPLVGLAMGYPSIDPPVRPRYPMDFHFFDEKYPELSDEQVEAAIKIMDEGYLAQDYYRNANYMIDLEGDRDETYTFENYSWTEHISRKLGLWGKSSKAILKAFKRCGFIIPEKLE